MIVLSGINNDYYAFCNNCYQHYHTCNTCINQLICGFKNDHSEPQVVMKTVHQGFMTMQQQVKNPNLIAKHCTTCKCSWDRENCHKDNNGICCPNYQLNTEILK